MIQSIFTLIALLRNLPKFVLIDYGYLDGLSFYLQIS